jgi:Fic family protein
MASKRLFDHPSDMEPLLPQDREGRLAALGLDIIRRAERLRGGLHPITRRGVAELVRSMNSYYSNLIEGHRTMPCDIDAAVRQEFSGNAERRGLQRLHWAHLETQRWMESALAGMKPAEVCSVEFLRRLHREFYLRLPNEARSVEDVKGRRHAVKPGELRVSPVTIGLHVAPAHGELERFLRRFAEFYGPLVEATPQGLIAATAAHHRLAWIHPFLDGNGRVTRLFTQAWLHCAGAAADGLWTLARGFARKQQDYRVMLAGADERRLNDFDGRGYLSERRLVEFCEFALATAVDQLDFMHELLDLQGMEQRVAGYAERREAAAELPKGAASVLREVLLRGQIARGDVARIIGASLRTGQTVTGKLLRQGLLLSNSPKGPLRLGFPASAAGSYFPNLFPAGAD